MSYFDYFWLLSLLRDDINYWRQALSSYTASLLRQLIELKLLFRVDIPQLLAAIFQSRARFRREYSVLTIR